MSLFPGNIFIRFPPERKKKKKNNLIRPLGVIFHHQQWDKSKTVNKLISATQELEISYL